jgi:uncharacterized protein (TIGR00730 family)
LNFNRFSEKLGPLQCRLRLGVRSPDVDPSALVRERQAASGGPGMIMQRLCVFCGSRVGANPLYIERARQLGQALARRGVGLVYGAGHIGLMGILADAVLAEKGEAVGVIPQALVERELAHSALSQLHVVAGMHERKALMAALADGFLALPGGYGTLDETFEMLTWAQLGIHAKPIGLLNVGGFFDPLLAWLDRAVQDDFVKPRCRDMLLVDDDVERILARLIMDKRPSLLS